MLQLHVSDSFGMTKQQNQHKGKMTRKYKSGGKNYKKKRCKLNTENIRMRIQKKNNNMREKKR